jgi:hypothetical protein
VAEMPSGHRERTEDDYAHLVFLQRVMQAQDDFLKAQMRLLGRNGGTKW